MKDKKGVRCLAAIVLFGICLFGFHITGSEVQAEGTVEEVQEGEVYTIREGYGDLEPLRAIAISEETLSEWSVAEVWQYRAGNVSFAAEQFLTYGSDYGYEDMTKRSHAAERQYAYQKLDEMCRSFTVSGRDAEIEYLGGAAFATVGIVDLSDLGCELTTDEKVEVYFTFRNDNPQYFWLSNEILFSTDCLIPLTYDAYMYGADRTAALEEIVTTVQEVYQSQITSDDSKYQKVLKIHDALIADIEYDDDIYTQIAHSIAGALTSPKEAVCEGYAKVMQVLMNGYGITNIYVTGDAGGGHAWNMVRMNDGKYYWLDATWDDQEDEIFQHQYFLVGNENFTDHTPDSPINTGVDFLYELPQASDEDYVYTPDVVVIVRGDINADGNVDLLDLMMCLNHVSKKNILSGDAYTAADVNEDAAVDLLDLMRILNYVSKKSSTV